MRYLSVQNHIISNIKDDNQKKQETSGSESKCIPSFLSSLPISSMQPPCHFSHQISTSREQEIKPILLLPKRNRHLDCDWFPQVLKTPQFLCQYVTLSLG